MSMSQAAMGNAFQSWAIVLTGVIAHRLYLENRSDAKFRREQTEIMSEVPRRNKAGTEIRVDTQVRGPSGNFNIVAEFKWSESHPDKQLVKAYRYLCSLKTDKHDRQPGHEIIIVCSPSKNLYCDKVQEYFAENAPEYSVDYVYQSRLGTNVTKLISGTGKQLIVIVLVSDSEIANECGRALAILLTLPKGAASV